jgi:hypothetical protein
MNDHRERLNPGTSLVDGAIVRAYGNNNRKRVTEMFTPCLA